jgi:hypothetical protein
MGGVYRLVAWASMEVQRFVRNFGKGRPSLGDGGWGGLGRLGRPKRRACAKAPPTAVRSMTIPLTLAARHPIREEPSRHAVPPATVAIS